MKKLAAEYYNEALKLAYGVSIPSYRHIETRCEIGDPEFAHFVIVVECRGDIYQATGEWDVMSQGHLMFDHEDQGYVVFEQVDEQTQQYYLGILELRNKFPKAQFKGDDVEYL